MGRDPDLCKRQDSGEVQFLQSLQLRQVRIHWCELIATSIHLKAEDREFKWVVFLLVVEPSKIIFLHI